MFPLRKLILLDEDGDDGASGTEVQDSPAGDTSTATLEAPTGPKIATKSQPTEEALSKIKFDTSNMDEGSTRAPSEKETYEGIFHKLPKLDILKKQEADDKDKEGEEEETNTNTSRLDTTKTEETDGDANDRIESSSGDDKVSGRRDYSKFPKELAPTLKHFNNQAYRWFETHYPKFEEQSKELVETKAKLEDASKGLVKLPDNYYESPQAFLLDPGFQQISHNYDRATYEAQFWTEQLERIESGEPFQDLGYKDGKYFAGEARKPTARDKISVQSALNQALQYQRDFDAEAKALQNGFASKHKDAVKLVQDAMVRLMPWEADPKVADTKMPDGKTIKQFLHENLQLVPPQFRGNIMSKLWANTMVVNQMQVSKIAELEKKLGVNKTNIEHQRGAQPGDGKSGGGTANKNGAKKVMKFNTEGMDD